MSKEEADAMQLELRQLRIAIYGNGQIGISQKVSIMWRVHIWVLCSLSGGLGIVATIVIQRLMKGS